MAPPGGNEQTRSFSYWSGVNMNAKNSRGWTPLVIAEGIHTGGNFVHSDTTAELLRRLVAEPSPPDISREPISAYGRGDIQ
jgi:hypothetical protein